MNNTQRTEVSYNVEIDPRGESESYEPYMFVARANGKIVWFEGIRKDRSAMLPDVRAEVEKVLAAAKK